MKKMKKVLFFMFLLFLGLGTASVKAQVRIGGNTAPNASAVLDLNANDTNNGTKGLALPRVGLTSNTMLLPGVTANLTGMLVYNTSTTGGAGVNTIGIYFWNGATWVKASLPSTTPADSGRVLMSDGYAFAPSTLNYSSAGYIDTLSLNRNNAVSWTLIVDTALTGILPFGKTVTLSIPGIIYNDICVPKYNWGSLIMHTIMNQVTVTSTAHSALNAITNPIPFRCYRPSY